MAGSTESVSAWNHQIGDTHSQAGTLGPCGIRKAVPPLLNMILLPCLFVYYYFSFGWHLAYKRRHGHCPWRTALQSAPSGREGRMRVCPCASGMSRCCVPVPCTWNTAFLPTVVTPPWPWRCMNWWIPCPSPKVSTVLLIRPVFS